MSGIPARMCLRGEGGAVDPDMGVYWLEKGAWGETYRGAEVLAGIYETGSWGVPRDPERANYWRSQLRESEG